MKLIYFYGYFHNSYIISNGKYFNLLKNKTHFQKYNLVKNKTVLGFFLHEKINEDTNNNDIFITSNLLKEDILNYNPYLSIKSIKKDYLSFDDLKNNINFLINRRNQFKQDNNLNIDNNSIKDNIFNILISQLMNDIKGGSSYDKKIFLNILNNVIVNIKVSIENLKKTKNIKKMLKNIKLKYYNYAYVDIYNKQVTGIYLVKELNSRVTLLNVIMDYKNNRFTVNKKLRFKNPYKNIVMIFDPKKQFKIESTKEIEDHVKILLY